MFIGDIRTTADSIILGLLSRILKKLPQHVLSSERWLQQSPNLVLTTAPVASEPMTQGTGAATWAQHYLIPPKGHGN